MAPSKKKPDTPPGQGGTPPGQSGKPPKPVQTDVRVAVAAVGVAKVDIQLSLAPPVEPPPEGTRHTVGVAAMARGRVMAQTVVIPAAPPGLTTQVTLTWAAIDPASVPFGDGYTGYRVALQLLGARSLLEQFVPLASVDAVFVDISGGSYLGQCQLSTADLSAVDTTVVREGEVQVAGLPVTVVLA